MTSSKTMHVSPIEGFQPWIRLRPGPGPWPVIVVSIGAVVAILWLVLQTVTTWQDLKMLDDRLTPFIEQCREEMALRAVLLPQDGVDDGGSWRIEDVRAWRQRRPRVGDDGPKPPFDPWQAPLAADGFRPRPGPGLDLFGLPLLRRDPTVAAEGPESFTPADPVPSAVASFLAEVEPHDLGRPRSASVVSLSVAWLQQRLDRTCRRVWSWFLVSLFGVPACAVLVWWNARTWVRSAPSRREWVVVTVAIILALLMLMVATLPVFISCDSSGRSRHPVVQSLRCFG